MSLQSQINKMFGSTGRYCALKSESSTNLQVSVANSVGPSGKTASLEVNDHKCSCVHFCIFVRFCSTFACVEEERFFTESYDLFFFFSIVCDGLCIAVRARFIKSGVIDG